MTGTPTKTVLVAFVLISCLFLPGLSQEGAEEEADPVTEQEIQELREEISRLNEALDRLSSESQDLRDLLETNRNEVEGLREDLDELGESLANVRENTFDNERKLADLEETYRASARRNLLVAASGIVVGLAGLALFWAS